MFNISKQVILKWLWCGVFMLLHGNHLLANGRGHNKNKKYVELQQIFSWFCWGVLDLFYVPKKYSRNCRSFFEIEKRRAISPSQCTNSDFPTEIVHWSRVTLCNLYYFIQARMFFTLENQRNHRRKGLITKIIWQIYNYETNALPARCRAIKFIYGTIAEIKNAQIPHVMKNVQHSVDSFGSDIAIE
jgi:hypothetical protein